VGSKLIDLHDIIKPVRSPNSSAWSHRAQKDLPH